MNEQPGLSLDEAFEQDIINSKEYEYWRMLEEKLNNDVYRKSIEHYSSRNKGGRQ